MTVARTIVINTPVRPIDSDKPMVRGPDGRRMAADTDDPAEAATDPDYGTERQTAPQSPYSSGDVIRGALIAFLGIVLTFLIPILLI